MGKRIIILLLTVFTVCFIASCKENNNGVEYSDIDEVSSMAEIIFSTGDLEESEFTENKEDITDTLPLMIYYNDTVYCLKEEVFVITDDKLRASQVADNFESIGTIETIVPSNKYPEVNFSANFGDEGSFFEIYKYSDDDGEFITALWGYIQIWETQERHNQQ